MLPYHRPMMSVCLPLSRSLRLPSKWMNRWMAFPFQFCSSHPMDGHARFPAKFDVTWNRRCQRSFPSPWSTMTLAPTLQQRIRSRSVTTCTWRHYHYSSIATTTTSTRISPTIHPTRCTTTTSTTMGPPLHNDRNQWRIIPTLPTEEGGAPRNARVVVVLIGWWGASPRHLEVYAELYQSLLPSAAIVAGTASSTAILWKHDTQLRAFAKQGLETISSVLADYENLHLPVLVHVFSNGGGFVWHHMYKLLEEQEEAALQQFFPPPSHTRNMSVGSMDTEETPLHTNTADSLLRKNIRGQIWDSAPAYPKFESGMAALEGSGMVRGFIVSWILKLLFVVVYYLESWWDKLHGRPHRILTYWNDLWNCDWDVTQGFVHSSIDRMVDAEHLQDFIQHRRKLLGDDKVAILKFEDTPHVQHYRYHPEEYKVFVEDFMQKHVLQVRRKGQGPPRPA